MTPSNTIEAAPHVTARWLALPSDLRGYLTDDQRAQIAAASDAYVAAEAKRHWSDRDNQTVLHKNGRITFYTPPREDGDGVMQKAYEETRRPASKNRDTWLSRVYRFPAMPAERALLLYNEIMLWEQRRG